MADIVPDGSLQELEILDGSFQELKILVERLRKRRLGQPIAEQAAYDWPVLEAVNNFLAALRRIVKEDNQWPM